MSEFEAVERILDVKYSEIFLFLSREWYSIGNRFKHFSLKSGEVGYEKC